jgi:hypothetical protein
MNILDFNSKLTDVYEYILNDIEKCRGMKCDSKYMLRKFVAEYLANYASFIPDFFSKNGDAENVRAMYRTLRENEFPGVTITCVDTYKASEIYNEYLHGMVDFLKEIVDCSNSVFSVHEEQKYADLLAKAKEKDYEFVKSCFGGNMNSPVDEDLRNAVKNVEMLIDFDDQIYKFKTTAGNLTSSITDVDADTELLCDAVYLYIKSVVQYSYLMLTNVFDAYHKISQIITNQAPKPEPKFTLM